MLQQMGHKVHIRKRKGGYAKVSARLGTTLSVFYKSPVCANVNHHVHWILIQREVEAHVKKTIT